MFHFTQVGFEIDLLAIRLNRCDFTKKLPGGYSHNSNNIEFFIHRHFQMILCRSGSPLTFCFNMDKMFHYSLIAEPRETVPLPLLLVMEVFALPTPCPPHYGFYTLGFIITADVRKGSGGGGGRCMGERSMELLVQS